MTFLYLNSDKMGEGNPELGKKLLKSFLSELAESDVVVNMVGCVNSGINLTTEGSEVIDSLKVLEEKGAMIASCGSCLDFHDQREKLLIGSIGTMNNVIEIMVNAKKIIRPN